MKVEVVAVYRKRVRCVLTGSRGRVSESWRHWLVLGLRGKLSAVAIEGSTFRALRKSGVALSKVAVHAMRKDGPMCLDGGPHRESLRRLGVWCPVCGALKTRDGWRRDNP